jgi:photosystem II stability/assembly factor-like uncharacterized protein
MSTDQLTIIVGTVGSGIFRSGDGGQTWQHAFHDLPVPPWSPWIQVRGIAASPWSRGDLVAATDVGLLRSEDFGQTWQFVPSPFDRRQGWAVAYHPQVKDLVLAGAAPFEDGPSVMRSEDNGRTWAVAEIDLAARAAFGACHVTSFAFDPVRPERIWLTAEIDGMQVSEDLGRTWRRIPPLGTQMIQNSDVHSCYQTSTGTLFATTPNGVWRSTDEGASFALHEYPRFDDPEPAAVKTGISTYARGIAVLPGETETLLVGTGDWTPGKVGDVQRSTDDGISWAPCGLAEQANSNVYAIATSPGHPATAVAATMFGQLFITSDGGQRWDRLAREFGEIRGLACI